MRPVSEDDILAGKDKRITLAFLVARCAAESLATTGRRAEVLDRLQQHLRSRRSGAEAAPTALPSPRAPKTEHSAPLQEEAAASPFAAPAGGAVATAAETGGGAGASAAPDAAPVGSSLAPCWCVYDNDEVEFEGTQAADGAGTGGSSWASESTDEEEDAEDGGDGGGGGGRDAADRPAPGAAPRKRPRPAEEPSGGGDAAAAGRLGSLLQRHWERGSPASIWARASWAALGPLEPSARRAARDALTDSLHSALWLGLHPSTTLRGYALYGLEVGASSRAGADLADLAEPLLPSLRFGEGLGRKLAAAARDAGAAEPGSAASTSLCLQVHRDRG